MQGVFEFIFQLGAGFSAGLYVAISPCLFPLLPLFLIRTLQSEDSRKRSVLVTSILILGILTSIGIFVLISWIIIELLLIQEFGLILLYWYTPLRALLGAVIIFFGILMISEKLKMSLGLASLSLKTTPSAPRGLVSVYMVGLGYTIMAAPCALPAIGAVISLFGAQSTIWGIILLYLGESIGIAIPYLAIALVTGEARIKMATRISRSARHIEVIVGVILIIIGVILILPFFGFVI